MGLKDTEFFWTTHHYCFTFKSWIINNFYIRQYEEKSRYKEITLNSKGETVHTTHRDCIIKMEKDRVLQVFWEQDESEVQTI